MIRLIIILLLICTSANAQSGVALDAWVRSKDTAENTYNKSEIDAQLGGIFSDLAVGNKVYYCSSGTEDIGAITYGTLTETYTPEVSTVTIGPVADTSFSQYSPGRGRITPQLGVTQIPAGVYNRVSHMSNSNTSGRNVEIVYELWRVDSSGTKISRIATSSVKLIDSPTGNAIQRLDNEYVVSAPVTVLESDRLLEEFFFRRVGLTTGTAPTITRYIGGSRSGFLNLALPSGVVMRTDGSNAAETVTLTNLNVTGSLSLDGFDATNHHTLSGNIGAASTTIELTDGIKLNDGIMFLGGATYDLSNTDHATLDNTGANTVITFDAVGFDTSYVILRLR